jgi:hypothetical protein
MLKFVKSMGRKAQYKLKGKDPIQRVVLEASRDDDEGITENEFFMVAKLSYTDSYLESIRKTLIKRFRRIQNDTVPCRKALQLLDFCLRFGSDRVREITQNEIHVVEALTHSHVKAPGDMRGYTAERVCREQAQHIIDMLKNEKAFTELRRTSMDVRQRVQHFVVDPAAIGLKGRYQIGGDGPMDAAGGFTAENTFSHSEEKEEPDPVVERKADTDWRSSPVVHRHRRGASKKEEPEQATPVRSEPEEEDEDLDFDPMAARRSLGQQRGSQPPPRQPNPGAGRGVVSPSAAPAAAPGRQADALLDFDNVPKSNPQSPSRPPRVSADDMLFGPPQTSPSPPAHKDQYGDVMFDLVSQQHQSPQPQPYRGQPANAAPSPPQQQQQPFRAQPPYAGQQQFAGQQQYAGQFRGQPQFPGQPQSYARQQFAGVQQQQPFQMQQQQYPGQQRGGFNMYGNPQSGQYRG